MQRLAVTGRSLSALPWKTLATGLALAAAGSVVTERARRRRLMREGRIGSLTATWLPVDGGWVHMRYADRAASPHRLPVVLVHGWGVSSAYFIPTAERLAVDFEVYAPDLPGHGYSSLADTSLDVPGQATALAEWMKAAGLERAILVGHSLGCQIAVAAARRYPGRVARLVLIAPTVDPAARSLPQQFLRLLLGSVFERPSLLRHLLRDYARMHRWLLPELRGMLADAIETDLAELQQPVMLVRGGKDRLVPSEWLHQAARLAGARRTVEIPGWGHAVQYSAAERLTRAIRPFLHGGSSTPAGRPTVWQSPARQAQPLAAHGLPGDPATIAGRRRQ